MITSVLIVRLVGLHLLLTNVSGLFPFSRLKDLAGPAASLPGQGAVVTITVISAVTGRGAALFAGPLTRALTFDPPGSKRADDFSDRVLRSEERTRKCRGDSRRGCVE
jgi:hypothetical protein